MRNLPCLLLIVISSFTILSCQVEKRLHQTGYHVAFNGVNKYSAKNQVAEKNDELNEKSDTKSNIALLSEEKTEVELLPQETDLTASVADDLGIGIYEKSQYNISNKAHLQDVFKAEGQQPITPLSPESQSSQKEEKLAKKNKAKSSSNVPAILGFIFALLGVVLTIATGFPFFMGLTSLILGIIGVKKSKDMNGKGRGLSIAAIVLGSLMILYVLLLVVAFVFLAAAFGFI